MLSTVAVLSFINGRAYWCSFVPLCLSPHLSSVLIVVLFPRRRVILVYTGPRCTKL